MSTGSSAAPRTFLPAKNLAVLFDFAVGSNRRALAMLVFVSLIAFLPGFFQIPPVDRDEARFAQATKQMIETGEYVDIRFQNKVRYKKPVGYDREPPIKAFNISNGHRIIIDVFRSAEGVP